MMELSEAIMYACNNKIAIGFSGGTRFIQLKVSDYLVKPALHHKYEVPLNEVSSTLLGDLVKYAVDIQVSKRRLNKGFTWGQ